jgi:hypothetical protein
MPETTVPADVRALAGQLAEPKPMRRGSVTERYVKCNKAGCLCGEGADARHGPYFSVSRVVAGKTRSRWLNADEAKVVRAQVEAGQEFRKHVEAYWQACEQWADAEVQALAVASESEAAKKGASKRPSRSSSSKKSKS